MYLTSIKNTQTNIAFILAYKKYKHIRFATGYETIYCSVQAKRQEHNGNDNLHLQPNTLLEESSSLRMKLTTSSQIERLKV